MARYRWDEPARERKLTHPDRTAAALAYGLHNRDLESKFLVFDLGRGTFDVSVLELFEGIMEVRTSAGDNFLGGEDFAELLATGFLQEAGAEAGLARDYLDSAQLRQLHGQAERAKHSLTRGEPGAQRRGGTAPGCGASVARTGTYADGQGRGIGRSLARNPGALAN